MKMARFCQKEGTKWQSLSWHPPHVKPKDAPVHRVSMALVIAEAKTNENGKILPARRNKQATDRPTKVMLLSPSAENGRPALKIELCKGLHSFFLVLAPWMWLAGFSLLRTVEPPPRTTMNRPSANKQSAGSDYYVAAPPAHASFPVAV